MKNFILFLILIPISTKTFSQSSISELEKRMKTENDTAQINTMNEIAGLYANRQMFDSDYYYLEKMYALSQKTGYQKGLAMSYNGFGIVAMVKGEYKKAMENYFKGLQIAEANGMGRHIMMISSNIASVYITQGEFKQAIPILKKVIRLISERKDTIRMFPLYAEVGFCYYKEKQNDSASFYYETAMALCNALNAADLPEDRFNQYVHAKSTALETATAYYLSINEPQKALANLLPFWEQIKSSPLIYNQLNTLNAITETYFKIKDYEHAIRYADIGIALDSNKNHPEHLQALFKTKADASYATGKFDDAYKNHLVYTELKDSVYSAEKFNAIKELQVKYDTEKKESEIITLNKEKKAQQFIVGLAIAGLLVALGLLAFAIRSNRLQKKLFAREKEIQKKEQEQKMFELQQTALRAQMNPHFIFNCLNSVQRFIINNDTEGFNHYLTTFANLIRQTLENSGKELIPLKDEILYLETYIKMEQLRSNSRFEYNIQVSPDVDVSDTYIPNMIVQPFIENSILHGMLNPNGQKGMLRLDISQNDKLTCIVDDNGVGIKSGAVLQLTQNAGHVSMGGTITEKRIQMYNSLHEDKIELQVVDKSDAAEPGTGTRVILKFPLNN
ncbi:MAG TPA: histidine kinase [Ferruginibacter sp.]|nr:histidine kinase [Ferruginibacter sp.]